MTAPTRPGEDPREILQQSIALLRQFLEAQPNSAFSSRALEEFLATMQLRLQIAAANGRALPLLRRWSSLVPSAVREGSVGAAVIRFEIGADRLYLDSGQLTRVASICPSGPEF